MRRIRLGRNAVPALAEKEIIDVFRSGQYSPGLMVREFEEKFAKLHKAEYAVFVNSGTDALRLGLLALKERHNWPDGSLVAVPALTFPATVNVILQSNLKPLFVDVGMYDYLINVDHLQRQMDCLKLEGLVAVIPVHLFGQKCGDGIYDFAKKNGWKVLEDSCETILNPIRGDISCHSTYMAHHVTTGVGGVALTNDKGLRDLIWSYGNHGRRRMGAFEFDRIGYSSRATEFEAVMGLSQLKGLKKNIEKRRGVFVELLDVLGQFDDLQTVGVTDNTCMMFPIVIKETSKLKKKPMCDYLNRNGIETRDMMPITNQPCYKDIVDEDDYSVAEHVNRNGFYVGCHEGMTKADVHYIAETLDKYANRA